MLGLWAEMEIVINASGVLLGRLCTHAAKQALLGHQVRIVNCDRAVVSGKKPHIRQEYYKKWSRGVPKKGPFILRRPERFVKRTVRGMLPHRQSRGRAALKRVRCFTGMPDEYKDKQYIDMKKSNANKIIHTQMLTVRDICSSLGGRA
jgi:large subunit ribosomal protein L13